MGGAIAPPRPPPGYATGYWSLPLTKNRFFLFYDKSELRVWKGLISLWVNKLGSRKRGRDGKSVVLMMSRFAWFGFNQRSGHVVVSLDKTLYDDYLCLIASNKSQIQWTRI